MTEGLFITVEGIDGTGKTSVLNAIEDLLALRGLQVVRTKEPGRSQIGATIRRLLFEDPGSAQRDGVIPLSGGQIDCLMLADHIGHVEQLVEPSLRAGKVVLSDRYVDSQLAYIAGRAHSPHMIEPFKKHFGPVPDITVLLTGDVAECLARARKRDISKDALEPGKQDAKQWAKVEIQTRIQFAYIMNLANQPRTLMVDTRGKGLDAVCAEVVQRIKLRLDAPIPRQSSIFSVDDCAHQEHRA